MHKIESANGQRYTELSDEQFAVYEACRAELKTAKRHSRFKWNSLQLAVYVRNVTVGEGGIDAVCCEFKQELARIRRNRASRERNEAMRGLGLTKTAYGWE